HQVDAVGQVFPGTGNALDLGLPAQLAFGTDLAGDAGDFGGERIQLIDHDVDRVLQLEDLALDLDRDLLGEVALLHGRGDVGDVAHLGREVGGELVDVVGEVAPGAGGAQHVSLAAQAAVVTDLARHPRDFGGEGVELVDHPVDRVLQVAYLALDIDGDFLREVASGDRGGDVGDVAYLGGEIARHRVDVVGQVTPGTRGARNMGLAAQAALGADLASHARDFGGEGVQLIDHDVDGVLQLEDLASDLDRDLLGEVALLHGGGDLGDVANLGREIGGELVHLLREVLPGPGRTRHARLATEATLGTDLARHARDLAGEPVQLVDHAVDRVLQL